MGKNLVVPAVQIIDPHTPTKRTYASPLSYLGSARRIWASSEGWRHHNIATKVLAWVLFPVMLYLAWSVVTVWYLFVVLPFFFVAIPFRLVRRGQRKQDHRLEAMQAMVVEQHAALGLGVASDPTREMREVAPGADAQHEVQDVRNWT
jgi:hypothetical protein